MLKNNVFTFGKKTLKQIRGTAIGTKFAPPYSILFMAELEEEILREVELKPYLWWRFIDDIFFIWEHGEEKLKEFIDVLILINIFILHITPITVKREFLIVKRSALIGLAQILDLLIGVVMTWKDGYKKEAIQKSKSGNQY